MKPASYTVESETPEQLVIRDMGPWTRHATVTNDAENVVASLFRLGILKDEQRLLYFDSEGVLGELEHQGGYFTGFKSVSPE
jgi:hypothetical protein